MKQVYGHPKEKEKPYMAELYCGMCNRIPFFDTWDRSTGKIVGVEIGDLQPVPISKMGEKGMEEVHMMTCLGCIRRIQAKMEGELMRRFGGHFPFKRPPQDGMEGMGGGMGVPRQPKR